MNGVTRKVVRKEKNKIIKESKISSIISYSLFSQNKENSKKIILLL